MLKSEYTGGIAGWGTMISHCSWCGQVVSEYETDEEGRCTVPIFDDSEGHRCPDEEEEEEKMKKVISGKLYNTVTAKRLGYWSSGHQRGDFFYSEETLYKTKSGAYFLHGTGGANSQYGKWIGNSGGPGEEIRPYTEREAREWCEENLSADEYISIWGDPEEA